MVFIAKCCSTSPVCAIKCSDDDIRRSILYKPPTLGLYFPVEAFAEPKLQAMLLALILFAGQLGDQYALGYRCH
jgi:hypothetical protein